ncbi:hypothetical protein [Staphylococcus felis]|nr:hypothetical protein [Staphylococcus felis]
MTKHKIHYVNPVNLIYVYLRIKLFVEYLFKFVKYVFENIKEVLRRD